MRTEAPSHIRFGNHSVAGAAGLLTMMRRSIVEGGEVSYAVVVQGLVSRLHFFHVGCELRLWRVGNLGLEATGMRRIETLATSRGRRPPLESARCFCRATSVPWRRTPKWTTQSRSRAGESAAWATTCAHLDAPFCGTSRSWRAMLLRVSWQAPRPLRASHLSLVSPSGLLWPHDAGCACGPSCPQRAGSERTCTRV